MSHSIANGNKKAQTRPTRTGKNYPLESRFPQEPRRRLEELFSICRKAEKDEGARNKFLDAVRNWRSDSALRAEDPAVWKHGDALIRDTFQRILQPAILF